MPRQVVKKAETLAFAPHLRKTGGADGVEPRVYLVVPQTSVTKIATSGDEVLIEMTRADLLKLADDTLQMYTAWPK